jgi:hypothetical protein
MRKPNLRGRVCSGPCNSLKADIWMQMACPRSSPDLNLVIHSWKGREEECIPGARTWGEKQLPGRKGGISALQFISQCVIFITSCSYIHPLRYTGRNSVLSYSCSVNPPPNLFGRVPMSKIPYYLPKFTQACQTTCPCSSGNKVDTVHR